MKVEFREVVDEFAWIFNGERPRRQWRAFYRESDEREARLRAIGADPGQTGPTCVEVETLVQRLEKGVATHHFTNHLTNVLT